MSARHEATRQTAPASMQTLMAQIAAAKPNTIIVGSRGSAAVDPVFDPEHRTAVQASAAPER
jgi:hypothetical protein